MPLPKQVKQVRVGFYSATAATEISTRTFSIQNMEISTMHVNPLGNPLYSESLDGTLVPYAVKSRAKVDINFERQKGADIATVRGLYNDVILYHNSTDVTMRLYYKYIDYTGATSTDYLNVLLNSPIEMVERYTSQVGAFAPKLSFIAKTVATSVPDSLEGV